MVKDPAPHSSLTRPGEAFPISPLPSEKETVFFGPNGLRAGWRILIFLVLLFTLLLVLSLPFSRFLHSFRTNPITPAEAIAGEGLGVIALLLAAGIMTRMEGHSFADYGLPLRQAFGTRFWQGVLLGFVMLTILLAIIATLHGFSLGRFAIGARAAVGYGLAYALAFLLVGFFEEFCFRGYLQSTLASGIRFWPAAVILAVVFGAFHLSNPGETKLGAIMAGCFGLLAAFALWRTGSVWLPIGMHASWDWAQSFFYSVPDSGVVAEGHLLSPSFHGATWLTGGPVGPEGSVFVFPVLLLWALSICILFPRHKAPPRGLRLTSSNIPRWVRDL